MNSGQRLIKLLATIFAIFLAISIIGAIIGGISLIFHISDASYSIKSNITELEEGYSDSGKNDSSKTYEKHSFSKTYTNIDSFEIDASINDVTLIEGTEFRVTVKDVYTSCKVSENNGTLKVDDSTSRHFLSWLEDFLDGNEIDSLKGGSITITYPKDFTANTCEINAGTASININTLKANHLDLEAGTGSITGDTITAKFMDLECGTGSVSFDSSYFSGTDIECGVGSVTIDGKMTGENTIECGVGSVDLNLEDSQDSYKIDIEKGLGTITIDGSTYSSLSTSSANAPNSLSIEGGLGDTTIHFAKQF